MEDFEAMGKEQLRAACRVAGISYAKMKNDDMRAALAVHYAPDADVEVEANVELEIAKDEAEDEEVTSPALLSSMISSMLGPIVPPAPAGAVRTIVEGKETVNPVAPAPKPRSTKRGSRVKYLRDLPTRNGIRKQSPGTIGDCIWMYLDAHLATLPSDLKAISEEMGWNLTSLQISYYRWKKFNA